MKLYKYRESLKSAWGYNDYNDWPIKVNSIIHLFLKDFAVQCLEDIKEIRGDSTLEKELIFQMGNPSRLYRLIDPIIFGMKRLSLPLSDQKDIVLYLLSLVKRMKHGSEFNEDGRNIVLSPEQVSEIIDKKYFTKTQRPDAVKIQKFCGIVWSYTESIFFRAHEVTKEIHGSYNLGDGKQLIIREYLNLNANEIWNNQLPFIKADNIKIYIIYDSALLVSIDSYNHLFLKQGDYISNMTEHCIFINGRLADVNDLMAVMSDIPKTIQEAHAWVENTNWREHANKYLDIYWFRKRPFRMVLGKSATADAYLRQNINEGDFDPRRIHNLTEKSIERLIQIVI